MVRLDAGGAKYVRDWLGPVGEPGVPELLSSPFSGLPTAKFEASTETMYVPGIRLLNW